MEPLAEAAEHDEGLWGEGASRDRAVRTLVAPRGALAAEASARELAARPSVAANARDAPALPPVELASVTWEGSERGFQCLADQQLDCCTSAHAVIQQCQIVREQVFNQLSLLQ